MSHSPHSTAPFPPAVSATVSPRLPLLPLTSSRSSAHEIHGWQSLSDDPKHTSGYERGAINRVDQLLSAAPMHEDPTKIAMPRGLSAAKGVVTAAGAGKADHDIAVASGARRASVAPPVFGGRTITDVSDIVKAIGTTKTKAMQWRGKAKLNKKLDVSHYILYRLSQIVEREKGSATTGNTFHPGHVNNQVSLTVCG